MSFRWSWEIVTIDIWSVQHCGGVIGIGLDYQSSNVMCRSLLSSGFTSDIDVDPRNHFLDCYSAGRFSPYRYFGIVDLSMILPIRSLICTFCYLAFNQIATAPTSPSNLQLNA